jgi:Cu-processing system permease protein
MVLIWDMALLGVLVVDAGQRVTAGVVDATLLLNPADACRLLNLAGLPGLGALSGMAGLAEGTGLTPPVLLAALLAWALLPLAGTATVFARREL